MLPIRVRIDRAQRLVSMLEEDAPLLAVRVSQLTPEHQQSAKDYAAQLTATARAELEKLVSETTVWENSDFVAEPAD